MTQSSPTCFHGALDYLSKLTGISRKKEIVLSNIEATRTKPNKKGRTELLFTASNIFVVINGKKYWFPRQQMIKGGEKVYYVSKDANSLESTTIILPVNTKFDIVGVVINRAIDEFGIISEKIGPYKDSLGGGWYHNCTMYKVGSCYYVPDMECACRHNGTD
jgi:hypothetical protein